MNEALSSDEISFGHFIAVVCNFRTFVSHFIPSIWLNLAWNLALGSYSRNGDEKVPVIFAWQIKGKSAFGLPIIARQNGGSKVIFWIQLESYGKDFSKSRDIHETIFPSY